MAEETRPTGQNNAAVGGNPDLYDTAPGARPPAAGAMNSAWGRTSADLATDQPAGHSPVNLRPGSHPLAGSDDVTGGLGGSKVDPDTGGDIRRGRHRELHPEVDPDTRLGLQPTVSREDLPDPPADVPANAGTRAATGAVAGAAGAAVLLALMYALIWSGQGNPPTFVAFGWALLGGGAVGHIAGAAVALGLGAALGALFGLLFARPTMLKGVAFGLLPALFTWLVLAPMTGHRPFYGGTAAGLGLAVLFDVLIWGGIVGQLCRRWLRPPYAADVSPTVEP